MNNIYIDTILYNPTIYVYNVDFVLGKAMVYNAVGDKLVVCNISRDFENDNYIKLDGNRLYLKHLFCITENIGLKENVRLKKKRNDLFV